MFDYKLLGGDPHEFLAKLSDDDDICLSKLCLHKNFIFWIWAQSKNDRCKYLDEYFINEITSTIRKRSKFPAAFARLIIKMKTSIFIMQTFFQFLIKTISIFGLSCTVFSKKKHFHHEKLPLGDIVRKSDF